ncbi:MAG: LLM class F420-dependent oxidoreductase [Candidatus Binatus sp.]|uniref:LLM class F420-dependent oxidoreductase n=1 Tax=Candidatus Binatus sp. TaxID=2811406 RepID=UPI0027199F9E|nr:LLM class F420-dependent oxidoreductase [Candidatus Binatus sp.]MDO8432588.1 LLM class F420-dependent oxidoreductase [Candidatus Binatus sp.]
MDIGIMIAATAESGDIAEIAREVENLGYESFFIPEHPVIPVGFKTPLPGGGGGTLPEHYGRWMDPFVALSVAAAVTRRVKLGTGICLLPEREPIITAKTIATLDILSGGRVILGVGAGWLREETEAMGARFETRWKRLRETVEAMRVLWTQSEPSYQGELVKFPALRCDPKPVQKPGPPILLGGRGPKVLERVVRTYDGWVPLAGRPSSFKRDIDALKQVAVERGRNPDTIHVSGFVGPPEDGISLEDLKLYKDAGAHRLVLFSQGDAIKMAAGKTLEIVRRLAPTVERAARIK